jgi:hypothetical protein
MITLFTCLIILQFAIIVSHDLIARRSTPSRNRFIPQMNLRVTPVRLYGYNYNLSCCYPRHMADSNRSGMLFSSGDSPSSFRDPFGG